MYGEKLRKLRNLEGWTQKQVAEKIGVSKQTYSHYENENRKPGLEMIRKLAEVYQVDLDRVFGSELVVAEEAPTYKTSTQIPIVGRIACGPKEIAFEQIEGYEEVPESWVMGSDHFFLRAKGDSMINARIHEGDLVLIRRQDDVENGEIAAVVIDGEATLKRVYRTNGSIFLQAENSNYDPVILKNGDVRIIGKLKKVVMEF